MDISARITDSGVTGAPEGIITAGGVVGQHRVGVTSEGLVTPIRHGATETGVSVAAGPPVQVAPRGPFFLFHWIKFTDARQGNFFSKSAIRHKWLPSPYRFKNYEYSHKLLQNKV